MSTDAPNPITVTDKRGRVYTLKRPNVLAHLDLIEILGEAAQNQTYMAMVMPVLFIREIDGEPVTISSKREFRALIQQLDDDGLVTVATGMREHFMPASAEEAAGQAKKS